MPATAASPNPRPVNLVEKKGSKILALVASSMPEPVSRTSRQTYFPVASAASSGIDRTGARPLVVIKPSGVDYAQLKPGDLVVTDLDGRIVEGSLRPSSDLDTHTLLYREFPQIGGIVHTHSEFATSWAQACRPIP